MTARTVLRWLTGFLLALSVLAYVVRVMDPNYPVAPLELLVMGFVGVLALFWKGSNS